MSGGKFDEAFRNIMRESDEEKEAIGGYEAIENAIPEPILKQY